MRLPLVGDDGHDNADGQEEAGDDRHERGITQIEGHSYGVRRLIKRGNGIDSRTCGRAQIQVTMRSKP